MLGEKLRKLREGQNRKQADVARALKISIKTVNNWENDVSAPNIENLIGLCRLYHVSADELLGLEKEESIPLGGLKDDDRKKLVIMVMAYIRACDKE